MTVDTSSLRVDVDVGADADVNESNDRNIQILDHRAASEPLSLDTHRTDTSYYSCPSSYNAAFFHLVELEAVFDDKLMVPNIGKTA